VTKLDNSELQRYARQILLPEIGIQGQKLLKEARILIVGLGGLGSASSMYLAAAGAGIIGIIDHDTIDLSNLNRQILYGDSHVGDRKTKISRERLQSINSGIKINVHESSLDAVNASDVCGRYDLVVDGTDNFETRYILNDTCVRVGIPYIYGSILGFCGQVSVFNYKGGPCYRCIYPDTPEPGQVPQGAGTGVLGAVPGIVGSIQAAEAIKIITGAGTVLYGRMLLVDTLHMTFSEIDIPRDNHCSACGKDSDAVD